AGFFQLLADLFRCAVPIGPVEANAGGTILQSLRAMKCRQRNGQPIRQRLTTFRFHPLPRLLRALAVEMWMSPLHLGYQCARNVAEPECAPLLGEHGMEEHLQQDVAELLAHEWVVLRLDSLIQLVRFLDQIWSKSLMRLCRIPVAALAQIAHQLQRVIQSNVT